MTSRAHLVAMILLCLGLLTFAAGTDTEPLKRDQILTGGVAPVVTEMLAPKVVFVPNLSWPNDNTFGNAHRRLVLKLSNINMHTPINTQLELFDENGKPIVPSTTAKEGEGTVTLQVATGQRYSASNDAVKIKIAPRTTVTFLVDQTATADGKTGINARFGFARIENSDDHIGLVGVATGFGGAQKTEVNDGTPTTVLLNGGRPF